MLLSRVVVELLLLWLDIDLLFISPYLFNARLLCEVNNADQNNVSHHHVANLI